MLRAPPSWDQTSPDPPSSALSMLLPTQGLGQGCDLRMCLWALREPRWQVAPARPGVWGWANSPPCVCGHTRWSVRGSISGCAGLHATGEGTACASTRRHRPRTPTWLPARPSFPRGWDTDSQALVWNTTVQGFIFIRIVSTTHGAKPNMARALCSVRGPLFLGGQPGRRGLLGERGSEPGKWPSEGARPL